MRASRGLLCLTGVHPQLNALCLRGREATLVAALAAAQRQMAAAEGVLSRPALPEAAADRSAEDTRAGEVGGSVGVGAEAAGSAAAAAGEAALMGVAEAGGEGEGDDEGAESLTVGLEESQEQQLPMWAAEPGDDGAAAAGGAVAVARCRRLLGDAEAHVAGQLSRQGAPELVAVRACVWLCAMRPGSSVCAALPY